MRYALLVSYDGTEFCGWQKQKNGRTVQGTLEEAAEEIFGDPVKIAGSGRTDAGVHARGQVCHLDGETNTPPEKLRECFNRLLPPDVRVLESATAPEEFDCTRGAKKKTYLYRAYYAETERPLLARYCARLKEKPDLARMREGAALIEGEHDFKAFRATGSSAKTTVRTVYSVRICAEEREGATVYEIAVCGNGFLYNMVRILAGELFAVGCGKGTEGISLALATGERKYLAKTMPACGLTLDRVVYDTPLFGAEKER